MLAPLLQGIVAARVAALHVNVQLKYLVDLVNSSPDSAVKIIVFKFILLFDSESHLKSEIYLSKMQATNKISTSFSSIFSSFKIKVKLKLLSTKFFGSYNFVYFCNERYVYFGVWLYELYQNLSANIPEQIYIEDKQASWKY